MSAGWWGYQTGAFILPFLLYYVILRIAGTKPSRKWLRMTAGLLAVVIGYSGARDPDGAISPGGILAALICLVWACIAQSKADKPTTP